MRGTMAVRDVNALFREKNPIYPGRGTYNGRIVGSPLAATNVNSNPQQLRDINGVFSCDCSGGRHKGKARR